MEGEVKKKVMRAERAACLSLLKSLIPTGEAPYLPLGNANWVLELKRSGQWFYWSAKLFIFTPTTYEMKLCFHFVGGKWCEMS